MIHWLWLIPAFIIGATAGMVLTCAVVWRKKEAFDD